MAQRRRIILLPLVLAALLQACAKPEARQTPLVTPAGSRNCPIPLQATAYFDGLSTTSDPYVLALTLTDVIRGEEALNAVKASNALNTDPPEGMEYMLVSVHAKAIAAKEDSLIDLHPACFSVIGQDGTAYDEQVSVAGLTPLLGGMYQGAERDGYIYFLLDEKQSYPYVVFLSGVNDGLWFATDPKAVLPDDVVNQSPSLEGIDTKGNSEKGNRALPYSPKEKVNFTYSFAGSGDYSATIALNGIERGKSALKLVDKADEFHPDVPEGKEYLLASFTITLQSLQKDGSMDFNRSDFALVAEDGNVYNDFVYIDEYEDDFEAMSPGETRTGSVYFLVDESDKAPKLVFMPQYNAGLWFVSK